VLQRGADRLFEHVHRPSPHNVDGTFATSRPTTCYRCPLAILIPAEWPCVLNGVVVLLSQCPDAWTYSLSPSDQYGDGHRWSHGKSPSDRVRRGVRFIQRGTCPVQSVGLVANALTAVLMRFFWHTPHGHQQVWFWIEFSVERRDLQPPPPWAWPEYQKPHCQVLPGGQRCKCCPGRRRRRPWWCPLRLSQCRGIRSVWHNSSAHPQGGCWVAWNDHPWNTAKVQGKRQLHTRTDTRGWRRPVLY